MIPDNGLTRSVIIYIVESDSTTSINLRTSGCRVVRNLRTAFCTNGFTFFMFKSYSKTETGLPSSCGIGRVKG